MSVKDVLMKEVRLIATDMDNTLLTSKGELPPNFKQTVFDLVATGREFVIASGRPLYTLKSIFYDCQDMLSLIGDNGAVISHKGELIDKRLLAVKDYQEMVHFVLNQTDGVPIICGVDAAVIAKEHREYEPYFRKFYSEMIFVDDLTTVDVSANKFTIFFPNHDSTLHFENVIGPAFSVRFSVAVSDVMWIDIMNVGVNKGVALETLGKYLEISPAEMMAFGDTYNDIQMLQAVKYSYLVANAGEEMRQYAKFETASNDEYGVFQVLHQLLDEE
ncbi:MAG: Cof-type HAD-IIB family hydrolase [Streptococcaceae bacterium]|jgi:Cof subfamily protein (haloacid dehalogenase superfamily)|nr:Cof-type HAD-IIB family hydrolase [Streptococcaceae bacterium]